MPRVSHTGLAPFRRCVGRCGSAASPNRSFGRSNVAKTSALPSARLTTLEYGCVPLNVQSIPSGENAWPEMAMLSGEVPLLLSYVWASTWKPPRRSRNKNGSSHAPNGRLWFAAGSIGTDAFAHGPAGFPLSERWSDHVHAKKRLPFGARNGDGLLQLNGGGGSNG